MNTHKNQTVSFDDEMLILVDSEDNVLGYKDKISCHLGEGILHRAFSIFIFNSKGRVLMQRRSRQKQLWPLYWSNSCCSHPRKGEDYQLATRRRLKEELGLETDLHFLYKFQYQAAFGAVGSENELCSVYVGKSDDPVQVNDNEIAEWKFFSIPELEEELAVHPENFTPWFQMEWKQLRKKYWDAIRNL